MSIAKSIEDKLKESVLKKEEECNSEDRQLRLEEIKRCAKSFLYFLRYVKIIEPPTKDTQGGVINLELWDCTKQMISVFITKKLIVILKSRQIGASWTVCAYCLWNALFKTGSSIMLFSKGEKEAWELLNKCRRIYSFLPDFMKIRVDPDSASELGFPVRMSSIKAFAATEAAGISFTSSIVVDDEWEEHPYADQNYLASKPTRDAGGQFIGIFTVNKLKPDTLAKAIERDAHEGKNDFTSLFFPYMSRPGRDEKWYEDTKRNIPDRELSLLTPDLYMEQNYPRSREEALRTTQSVSAFDHRVLDEMMGETKNPVKLENKDIDTLITHIYKPFHIGEFYVAGSDTSHGVGQDFSVTVVLNVKTGEVVADVMSNHLSPEDFALYSVNLLKYYQSPKWWPEDNEWGMVTINTAKTLGYTNFGYRDKSMSKVGWHTGDGFADQSRFLLWGNLIPAINNRQIKIYSKEGLKQFYDIIRVVEKNGKVEAMIRRHDDYPFAVGICWAKRDSVGVNYKSEPIGSLNFRKDNIPVAPDRDYILDKIFGGKN